MQDLVQPCMFNEILAVRKLAALPGSALGCNMFGGKEIFTIVDMGDMALFSEHAFARLPFSVAQSSCRGLERPWGSEHQHGSGAGRSGKKSKGAKEATDDPKYAHVRKICEWFFVSRFRRTFSS